MENKYDISFLVQYMEKKINDILRANLYEAGLNEDEIERLRSRKKELREALNNCGVGDEGAKRYTKGIIEELLTGQLKYGEKEFGKIIPFGSTARLSSRNKFDILLYIYKKEYQKRALEVLVEKTKILQTQTEKSGLRITDEDIENLYLMEDVYLNERDKKAIVVQYIYSMYRGLGVIDDIRDMKIDGVSGGVSGNAREHFSVWIFFKGININLSFLCFEGLNELERVCMNIYRYGNPGQLSKAKGYIIGEMKDNSRVVVVRPPFAESFAFFVRKFDNIESKEMKQLITDEGNIYVINLIKWIVKGCQVTAITGAQGSGKTTLLMSMIKYISPMYALRIQEMAFELHLRDIYPERNILTFRETDYISGQTGLDVQKKTDGAVNILGEIASIEVAAYLIQMSQVGSLFTLFTHHAKTTENLIKYMRNSLLSCGMFRDERIAREQVVEAIRFDVHMEKDIYGHRYVEKISEIVCDNSKKGYFISEIVKFEGGKYIVQNRLSEYTSQQIAKHLTVEERKEFFEEFGVSDKQQILSDSGYY